jgi:hypothetical protein
MLCVPKGNEEPSILQCNLTTEVDAATIAGQHSEGLVAEFAQLSNRVLERAQSA